MRFPRLFCLFLFLAVVATSSGETFRNPIKVALPATPYSFYHADLNNDGWEDLVYVVPSNGAAATSVDIHVLLNRNGSYVPAPTMSGLVDVGIGCALTDVDGDHFVDLTCVYGNTSLAQVALFRGQGDGTFAAPRPKSLGGVSVTYISKYEWLLPVGDMNGDGLSDLIFLDPNGPLFNGSWSLLTDRAGSFTRGSDVNSNSLLGAFFLDVNGDGIPDKLTSGPTVALGSRNGAFGASKTYGKDLSDTCAFGDIDGDGVPDAACFHTYAVNGDITGKWGLWLYKGHIDGSFDGTPYLKMDYGDQSNEYENYGTVGYPFAIADMNADGLPDVVTTGVDGESIFLQKTDRTLAEPRHFATRASDSIGGASAFGPFLIDVNRDGRPDLVGAHINSILYSLTQSDGMPLAPEAYEVTGVIGYTVTADFNGDGNPDLIAGGDNYLALSLGKGDGAFQPFTKITTGSVHFEGLYQNRMGNRLVNGDFNGDGKQDILAYGTVNTFFADTAYYYLQGNGDGTFRPPVPIQSDVYRSAGLPMYDQMVVADVNGDGRDDILRAPNNNDGKLYVLLSNGDGSFTTKISPVPQEYYNGGTFAWVESLPAVADLDGDGKADLAIGSHENLYVLHGNGDGTFALAKSLAIPQLYPNLTSRSVAIGDLDGDGKNDVVLLWGGFDFGGSPQTEPRTQTVVYYGDQRGSFSSAVVADTSATGAAYVLLGDLDHDGRPEIVEHAAGTLNGGIQLQVIHGTTARTFAAPVPYVAGQGLPRIHLVDLNHDGFPEIVASNGDYNGAANSVTVLMNLGNVPQVTGTVWGTPEPSTVGDPAELHVTLSPPGTVSLGGAVEFFVDGISVGTAPVSSNAAQIMASSVLTKGTHRLHAIWSGAQGYSSLEMDGVHAVVGLPTLLTLTNAPLSTQAGDNVHFTSVLSTTSTSAAGASGTVGYVLDGGSVIRTETLGGAGLPRTSAWDTASLPRGTHSITVTYSGDDNYAGSSATVSQTVEGIPQTMTLSVSPVTSFVGQGIVLMATLADARSCAVCVRSGSISFYDGTTLLGKANVGVNGVASLTTSFASAGSRTVHASFDGDDFRLPATADAAAQAQRADTTMKLASSKNPAYSGESITLTASLTNVPAAAPVNGGNIVFAVNGAPIGTAKTDASGKAVLPWILRTGTWTVTATFVQTANYNGSASTLSQGIDRSPTAITLTVSAPPVYQHAAVTLSAQVSALTGIPCTGQVQFLEGSTVLESVYVPVNGPGSIQTSTLPVGRHSITANYLGAAETDVSSSAVMTIDVLPWDFGLSSDPTATVLQTEHHLTFTATAQSIGNFSDTLSFTAENLPEHMTVNFTPQARFLSTGGTANVSVYLDTDDVIGFKSEVRGGRATTVVAWCLLAPGLLLLTRRRKKIMLPGIMILLVALGMSGCGNKYPASVTPGDYTIRIRATGRATGLSHVLELPVKVTR
ncbi:hypothetical protein FTW19_00400 [Terriglobus albidus]|uniref:Bacterial Ig-like domain-containing protein n=1 Tax=Terriglobus albidus TaxID=1592106 RepID=A0A5B9E4A2_9BACT|nr:FG-GAP-like repeat-containing protein [Terriglobus albidus]QEE26599.1 hypothetical protein FTW19_00400 [Terriglobus albidus]